MRRALRYLLLLGACMLFAAETFAGSGQRSSCTAAFRNAGFSSPETDGAPYGRHKPCGKALLVEGQRLLAASRLDVSAKSLLATEHPSFYSHFIYTEPDSPVTEFTQGVYHRYRPRDPTLG